MYAVWQVARNARTASDPAHYFELDSETSSALIRDVKSAEVAEREAEKRREILGKLIQNTARWAVKFHLAHLVLEQWDLTAEEGKGKGEGIGLGGFATMDDAQKHATGKSFGSFWLGVVGALAFGSLAQRQEGQEVFRLFCGVVSACGWLGGKSQRGRRYCAVFLPWVVGGRTQKEQKASLTQYKCQDS